MEFKYATSILFSNMGYVLKILLWIILSIMLVVAVGAAIMVPIFNIIVAETSAMNSIHLLQGNFDAFINAQMGIKDFIVSSFENVKGAMSAVASHSGAAVGITFAFIFLYVLYGFLSGLSFYPTADIINKIMSSNLRFGFASNMVLNFKNAMKYSGAKQLLSFPIDAVILAIMFGVTVGLFKTISFFCLPIVLLVGLLLCTLRALIFSGWLPRLLHHPEEKIFIAFAKSFTFVKANLKGFFKAYLITFTLAYLMIGAFSVPSFGLISLLVPSLYCFLLRTVELIGYYKIKGMSFYVDASTVINTVEFGYRTGNQQVSDEILENTIEENK